MAAEKYVVLSAVLQVAVSHRNIALHGLRDHIDYGYTSARLCWTGLDLRALHRGGARHLLLHARL